MPREEHDGQQHQTAGVYVGQRRLDPTGFSQGAPSKRAARRHRPDKRTGYVADGQCQHFLCCLHRATVSCKSKI